MAEQLDMTNGNALLGFLVMEKTPSDDGFIAALMVTDNRGYPLEFRATTPVKPSLVQRTLYGAQLEHYIGVELCGKALVRQSARKPKVLLVSDSSLLDLAHEVDVDLVALWRAGGTMRTDPATSSTKRGTITTESSSLVYEARCSGPETEPATIAHLQGCAGRFDLPEAFDRMRTALTSLAKEDQRFA